MLTGKYDMNADSSRAPIYPRRYFDASPTWFRWNKLSSHDIHALRDEPGFRGQNIAFHLNHPIRYVYLVGLLAQIDATGGNRYVLLSLDDGSGAGITVKINIRVVKEGDNAQYPSNTEVDNVDVQFAMGLPLLLVDGQPVGLNMPLKVKGTLGTFRGVRQVDLKRISVLPSTNDEVRAWTGVARYKADVLSKPWFLSDQRQAELDAELQRQELREEQRVHAKKEKARGREKQKQAIIEHNERRRQEQEMDLNTGALAGSEVVRQPWDY